MDDYVEFHAAVVRETARAVQLRFESGLLEWVPKSQSRVHLAPGEEGAVFLSPWIAQQKGLLDDEGQRKNVVAKATLQEARQVAQDAWLDAGGCPDCWGTSIRVQAAQIIVDDVQAGYTFGDACLTACACDIALREQLGWAPEVSWRWREAAKKFADLLGGRS